MRYFFFLFAACVSALAATLFTLAGVAGFDNSFPAADATFFDVVSPLVFFVAMVVPFCRTVEWNHHSIGMRTANNIQAA